MKNIFSQDVSNAVGVALNNITDCWQPGSNKRMFLTGERAYFGLEGAINCVQASLLKHVPEQEHNSHLMNYGRLWLIDEYLQQKDPEQHKEVKEIIVSQIEGCERGEEAEPVIDGLEQIAYNVQQKGKKQVLEQYISSLELTPVFLGSNRVHLFKWQDAVDETVQVSEYVTENINQFKETEQEFAEQGVGGTSLMKEIVNDCSYELEDIREQTRSRKIGELSAYYPPITEQLIESVQIHYLFSALAAMGIRSGLVGRSSVLMAVQETRQRGFENILAEEAMQLQFSLNKEIPAWIDNEHTILSAMLYKHLSEQKVVYHPKTVKKGTITTARYVSTATH